MQNWQNLIISPDTPTHEALRIFDLQKKGILCVCEGRTLLGIITDGDFRRALLNKDILDAPCSHIMNKEPVTASPEDDTQRIITLMNTSRDFLLLHLPIIDEKGTHKNILSRDDILHDDIPKPRAMIMAGGFGTRLYPLTKDTPKPMLKVGDTPLLERIIDKVRLSGITDITVTTHYLPDVIKNYFKDGKDFGVNIKYLHEDTPLGTAGALPLLDLSPNDQTPLLVMNGDILSDIDLSSLLRKHYSNGSAITVASRQYEMQVPYGVLEINSRGRIKELQEKPVHSFYVSAGIYVLQPSSFASLEKNSIHQMPDIISSALKSGYRVDSFVIHEEWIDIGQIHDFEKAQQRIKQEKNNGKIQ